jgi:hypothetical protein
MRGPLVGRWLCLLVARWACACSSSSPVPSTADASTSPDSAPAADSSIATDSGPAAADGSTIPDSSPDGAATCTPAFPPECYGTDSNGCCMQGGTGSAVCVAGQWMCGKAPASGCNGTPCPADAAGD